jgi:predicted nucleic acid-binding protein
VDGVDVPVVILDCSTTLSWFMPDENGTDAEALRTTIAEQGAVVPALWPIELGNAFAFATRARRVTTAQRAAALDALGQLPIEIDDETLIRIWTDTLALADTLRLTIYDACYLELAKRRRLPLATLDKELRAAARKIGVALA